MTGSFVESGGVMPGPLRPLMVGDSNKISWGPYTFLPAVIR